MRTIYAEPGEIIAASNELYKFYNLLRQKDAELNGIISELPSYWQGADATSVINKLNTALASLKKFETAAENYTLFLKTAGQAYETIEDTYGKSINVPTGG